MGNTDSTLAVRSRVDGIQQQQAQYNYLMAEKVSGQGQQLEDLASRNVQLSSRTDRLYAHFGEASLQLGRVQSDTNSLRLDHNRLDTQLQQFQGDQHNLNLAAAESTARMVAQYRMDTQQQGVFNDDIMSRAVALQEKLGNTATQMEVVRTRTDHLQHGLNELTLSHRQTNERFDQMQTLNNQQIQLLATNAVRLDEKQSNFMEKQSGVNESFLKCTDSLTEKQIATENKLELVNHRTDTLQSDQTKIDFELRLQRQIAEDRQRELTTRNLDLAERNVRVEEKQNCFINEQKTHNDHMINRTDNFRDKLAENLKSIDFVSYRVDNLHLAQQKAELEQKDKDKQYLETVKKVDVVESCVQNLRDEQKEIKELLHKLVAQVSAIDARTKTTESRLEALQADHNRLNELFIKFEAKNNK